MSPIVHDAITTTISTRIATERLPEAIPCIPPRKTSIDVAGTADKYQSAASGKRMYAGVTHSAVPCMMRLRTPGLLISVAGKKPHTAASDHATNVRKRSDGKNVGLKYGEMSGRSDIHRAPGVGMKVRRPLMTKRRIHGEKASTQPAFLWILAGTGAHG